MSLFTQLLARHAPPPPVTFNTLVDATGAESHWTFDQAPYVDRLDVANNMVPTGAYTVTGSPLVADDSGDGALASKATVYGQILNFGFGVTNGSFTMLMFGVLDRLPTGGEEKFVLFSLPAVEGGASIEVYPNGEVRCFSVNIADVGGTGVVERVTPDGVIQPGTLFAIGYSRAGSSGTQRLWVDDDKYQTLADFSGTPEPSTPDPPTWADVPAGQSAVGAWVSGIKLLSGMVKHVIYWSSGIPDATVKSLTAERLAGAAWLNPAIDFGDVEQSTAEAQDIDPYTHPEGLTATVTTQPTPSSLGSVAPNGAGSIQITGGDGEASGTTFGFKVTSNGADSATVTASFNTTAAAPAGDGSPRPSGDALQARDPDTGNPTPDAGAPIHGRSASTGAPVASGDAIQPRASD